MAKSTVLLLAFALFGQSFASLVGGWRDVGVTEENRKHVEDLARKGITRLDKKSNSMFASKLVEVTRVRSQVVAGTKYNISFTVGETDCRKNQVSMPQLESCNVNKVEECWVIVFEQIWVQYEKVSEPVCKGQQHVHKRSRRSVLGGKEEVEVRDKGVLAAVDFVMKDLNGRRNSLFRSMPVDLANVRKQLVSGYKYTFTLIVGDSKCKNDRSHKSVEECPVDKINGKMEKCFVEVHKSWEKEKPFNLKTFTCVPAKKNPNKKIISTGIDSKMNQIPLLGSDDHDNAHWGVFASFKQQYNKQYKNRVEEERRFKIFRENMKRVNQLNANELGDAKYGVTEFSDLSEEEFRHYYLNPKWDLSHRPDLPVAEIPKVDPPAEFDWRKYNAVTPVKNQGMCGSCWAFSTTGNIEGQWAVHKSKLVSLSEQELVDCDKLDSGCEGGLPVNAYEEIIRLGGLETEKKYPYDGEDEKCKFAVGDVSVYINGSVNISSNEADMAAWLYKNGPISIGINAFAMQFYMGGVSHPFSFLCSPEDLDHGVLIVGYGVKKGWFSDNPYWIVKNSWGSSWGEKGYYLVYRGAGVCGLNQMPTSAMVK